MTSNNKYGSLLGYMKKEPTDMNELKKVVRGKDMDSLLYDLLTTVSPHGKEASIVNIILGAISKKDIEYKIDPKGNLIVRVGDCKKSKVMFSCHTDTVQKSGVDTIDLRITKDGWVRGSVNTEHHDYVDKKGNVITKSDMEDLADSETKFMNYILLGKGKYKTLYGSDNDFDDWSDTGLKFSTKTTIKPKATILGADDKLGCYIMCQLILNKVEGLYVFHVGEECGGIGSGYISTTTPEVVEGMNYCIAFDRYGYNDVITSQSGGTCCSDEFAEAFCKVMNDHLPPKEKMSPSTRGTFTDSANYTKLISECTNIAVGYKDQHSSDETFDLEWLERMLIPALLKVKWSELPVKRDKNKVTDLSRYYGYGYNRSVESRRDLYSVKSSRKTSRGYRTNQSSIDKANDAIKKLDAFDVDKGFAIAETQKQRVDRVMYSWLQKNMSLKEIAEQFVEAYDYEDYTFNSNSEDDEFDPLSWRSNSYWRS